MPSKGSNHDGSKNKMENSTGKGWSPPSGKQNPPAAGAHTPPVTRHNGGSTSSDVHGSLKK